MMFPVFTPEAVDVLKTVVSCRSHTYKRGVLMRASSFFFCLGSPGVVDVDPAKHSAVKSAVCFVYQSLLIL